MTRRNVELEEVLASRGEDLVVLRLFEAAEAKGMKRRTEALRPLARAAAFRHWGALGVQVRRLPRH